MTTVSDPRCPRAAALSCAALTVACAASAQQTWIVDAQGGAGAHFSDLPAAVATASSGDVVIVRAYPPTTHVYQGATVSAGITVVGQAAAVGGPAQPAIVGALRVQGLAAGEHVVLADLRIGPFGPGLDGSLVVEACVGSVHLANVDRGAVVSANPAANEWRIEDCGLVTLTDCESFLVAPGARHRVLDTAACVMHRCELRAAYVPPSFFGPFEPVVDVQRSQLTFFDSLCFGQSWLVTGGPAFTLCDADLDVVGASLVSAGGQVSAFGPAPAGCSGASALRVAPGAAVVPALGPLAASAQFGAAVPALGVTIDGSSTATLRVAGSPGGLAAVAFGAPAATPAPLPEGLLYLDPAAATALVAAALDGQGRSTWTASLPPSLAVGVSGWLQAVVLDASALQLTAPTVLTAR